MSYSKSLKALLFAAVALLALGQAHAQDDIGIFFDPEFTQSQITIDSAPVTITGYLVLKNASSGYPVHGWECCVRTEGEAIVTNWQLEGQTINVDDPPCFIVGIGGDGLPHSDNILLATFEVLVTALTPVIFSVEPTYYSSLPDEMAYLSGPDADEIMPMYPFTGVPEVATINEDVAVAQVSHEILYYDLQPLGSSTVRTVNVANIGGGHLPLEISIDDTTGSFTLPGISGSTVVYGGTSINIPVEFIPEQLGVLTGVLNLGPNAPSVDLHGVGREAELSYHITGNLEFGDIPTGNTVTRSINIFNNGELNIPVIPQLLESCSGFSLPPGQATVIQPGQGYEVSVEFSPQAPGQYSCDLYLGDFIDPFPMSGSAHEAVISWEVTPESLDFGSVVVGSSRVMSFNIHNTGEGDIDIDVEMVDPVGYFHLQYEYGQFTLPAGDYQTINAYFSPHEIGFFEASISLGEVIDPVPLMGLGAEPNPQCQVTPTELDFGGVNVGGGSQRFFTVTNVGNVPLEISPFENSDHFYVQPFTQTIQPGSGIQIMVAFTPQAPGTWETEVSLGGAGCPPVHCVGEGIYAPPPGDDDLIGVFFDSYFMENEVWVPGVELIEAYLVLKNCSDPSGLRGWELRHDIVGDAIYLGAQIVGSNVNVGTYPDFIVGLADPLPPAQDIMLATMSYFVLQVQGEAFILLTPVSTPSIPGQMAYLSGQDINTIHPMYPFTGVAEVAAINYTPLSAEPPQVPEIQAQGGRVLLSWDMPEGMIEGYHVYRRSEDGEEIRLTQEPGLPGGDSVQYVDQPQGFENGAVLFYSYTLLENGTESPRSSEVRYEVQNVPAQVTRLLPNVPNPFNPQTTIRFQLSQSGQARVSIYDVSGRLVRTLESSHLDAGNHERIWMGKDNGGRQVPSGAYYVRLETPTGLDHRKIMLLK